MPSHPAGITVSNHALITASDVSRHTARPKGRGAGPSAAEMVTRSPALSRAMSAAGAVPSASRHACRRIDRGLSRRSMVKAPGSPRTRMPTQSSAARVLSQSAGAVESTAYSPNAFFHSSTSSAKLTTVLRRSTSFHPTCVPTANTRISCTSRKNVEAGRDGSSPRRRRTAAGPPGMGTSSSTTG